MTEVLTIKEEPEPGKQPPPSHHPIHMNVQPRIHSATNAFQALTSSDVDEIVLELSQQDSSRALLKTVIAQLQQLIDQADQLTN